MPCPCPCPWALLRLIVDITRFHRRRPGTDQDVLPWRQPPCSACFIVSPSPG